MVVLLSISVISAANTDLNNSTQKSNKNNELLGESDTGSLSDLHQNISSSGSTLNLTKNYVYNSTTDSSIAAGGIRLSAPISIDGNGHKIDAGKVKRIFEIYSSNILLKNIVFCNAHHSSNGGAVYVTNGLSNITFENCTFENNYATSRGAAIYTQSQVKIDFCYFINNEVASYGGAVFFYGPNSLVNNSIFYKNTADYGGAVYLYSQNITLYNST